MKPPGPKSKAAARGRQCGFTLIELMIAVVVVGILAAIAFPSFMDSIRKSRRSEAFTAMNNVQQAQERFRSNNSTYTTNLTSSPTDASTPGLGLTSSTPSGYYTIAVTNAGATAYTITATANAGTSQAQDTNCAVMGVRLTGANLEYASSGGSGSLSWAGTNPCWSR